MLFRSYAVHTFKERLCLLVEPSLFFPFNQPKVRLRSVADGQQVEIPVPRVIRTVGTQKDSMARGWEARGKRGRSEEGKPASQSESVTRSEKK